MRRPDRFLLAALIAIPLALAGCSHEATDRDEADGPDTPDDGDGGGDNGRYSVTIQGFAFHPDPVEISVGTTVEWTNLDDVAHTATSDDGSWDTGSISPGGSESVTFTEPGEYTYHCQPHSGQMTGTIIVTG